MHVESVIIAALIFFGGGIAMIFLISGWRESKRKRLFKRIAFDLGFEFRWNDYPKHLMLPHEGWFSEAGYSLSKYFLQHKDQSDEIYLFEAVRSGAGDAVYIWPTLALVWNDSRKLPAFTMGPRASTQFKLISKIINIFNRGEGDDSQTLIPSPEFNQKYQVNFSDEKALGELFNDEVIEFLTNSEPPLFVEGNESGLLVYLDPACHLVPERIPGLVDQARNLSRLIG